MHKWRESGKKCKCSEFEYEIVITLSKKEKKLEEQLAEVKSFCASIREKKTAAEWCWSVNGRTRRGVVDQVDVIPACAPSQGFHLSNHHLNQIWNGYVSEGLWWDPLLQTSKHNKNNTCRMCKKPMKKSHHVFAEGSHFRSICVFPLLSFPEVCAERETLNFQGFGEIAHQEPQEKPP